MRGGLLLNESVKTWRQMAIRIIIFILLGIFVLIPLTSLAFNSLLDFDMYSYTLQDRYDGYVSDSAAYREMAADTDVPDDSVRYLLSAEYSGAMANALRLFIDNNLTDSWQYTVLGSDYIDLCCQLRAYELLCEGSYSFEQLFINGSDFSHYLNYNHPSAKYVYMTADDGTGGYFEYDSLTGTYSPVGMTHAGFFEELKRLAAEVRNHILTATFTDVLRQSYDSYTSRYELSKLAEAAAKAEAASGDAKAVYYYETAQLSTETCRIMSDGYAALIKANAEYRDWRHRTVENVLKSATASLSRSAVMPKIMFDESNYSDMYDSYEQYVRKQKQLRTEADKAITLLNYSLEHGIPTPQTLDNSVKLTWRANLPSAVGIIQIFMVILAGTIVANEFSSGTVRLLLIRPKKRRKILTSKLLCTLVWSLGLMAAAYIIITVESMLINGISDTFTPDLYVFGGRVVEISGFLTALLYMLAAAVPAMLVASMAFLFSALARKSALAIALPIVFNAIMSTVGSLSIALRQLLPALDYTLFPYYDLTLYLRDPLSSFYGESLDMYSLLFGSGYGAELTGLNGFIGLAMFAVLTAVMIFLSYLSFVKRQIKN